LPIEHSYHARINHNNIPAAVGLAIACPLRNAPPLRRQLPADLPSPVLPILEELPALLLHLLIDLYQMKRRKLPDLAPRRIAPPSPNIVEVPLPKPETRRNRREAMVAGGRVKAHPRENRRIYTRRP